MPSNAYSALIIISGLLIWASSFVVLYAALSLGCIYGWSATAIRSGLALLWLAHLLALAALVAWSWRGMRSATHARQHGFAWYATVLVALVGLAGTGWTGLPLLVVTPCI